MDANRDKRKTQKQEMTVKITVEGPTGCGKSILLNQFASWLEKEGFYPMIGPRLGFGEHELRATKDIK